MDPERTPAVVVAVGLGGIFEGYGLHLPLLHRTRLLPLQTLLLVDGDVFEERNRERQHFTVLGPKAMVRREALLRLAPALPVRAVHQYVRPENVAALIPDGAVVLLSPDNHATRALVSDHVRGLDNVLLIVGANDGIDETAGTDGTEGWVYVYLRKERTNHTAPLEVSHPEIREVRERGPWEQSCGALLAQGARQILQTNLLVGSWMLQLLLRYVTLPHEEAAAVAEVIGNSRTGSVVLRARPPHE